MEVITKDEEKIGASGDFIYSPGSNEFASNSTISTGSVIIVSYYPIVKGREIITNASEISRINSVSCSPKLFKSCISICLSGE